MRLKGSRVGGSRVQGGSNLGCPHLSTLLHTSPHLPGALSSGSGRVRRMDPATLSRPLTPNPDIRPRPLQCDAHQCDRPPSPSSTAPTRGGPCESSSLRRTTMERRTKRDQTEESWKNESLFVYTPPQVWTGVGRHPTSPSLKKERSLLLR